MGIKFEFFSVRRTWTEIKMKIRGSNQINIGMETKKVTGIRIRIRIRMGIGDRDWNEDRDWDWNVDCKFIPFM